MCRNFCWGWQLWWELEVNCIGFIFCRHKKMYSWIHPPLGGIRGPFGCLGYFKGSLVCECAGKTWGFLALQPLWGHKELLPLEGFLGALWWLRSSAEPPPEIQQKSWCWLWNTSNIKEGVSIWEYLREAGL